MLEERYEKSEAGRAEIKSRSLVQARVARNLLLVIDATRTGEEWLGMVQGATPADLELLLQHRLVMPTPALASLSRPAPLSGPASTIGSPRGPATQTGSRAAVSRLAGAPQSSLDFGQLYTALSTFAKQQGLLKGYRLALEVEQCQDLPQLQVLALDVVDRVRATKGDAAAHELRATLGFH
ncbi:hypothetical protein [Roseateles amylovorans]|uniref:Uncharacterized protein n=1 Tax=Roseateles amylovorans TaxID=2978473 RepID=A0ABY6AYZ9_9BURK|nr:hypothetical protein [Roseateles amylovorans]UXH78143.1 hypothetical protein N4261_24855 [Roseateles amylovorans]